MDRPRSDMGRLQFQDIIFNFENSNNSIPTGVKIHFREPQETQVKATSLSLLQGTRLYLVSTLYLFTSKSNHLRVNLPNDHTLFLAHIDKLEQVVSIRPSTMSSWVKTIMERSGVDTTIYKAYSIRSASSSERSCALRWRLGWLPGGKPKPCLYHPNNGFIRTHSIKYLDMHRHLQLPISVKDPMSFILNKLLLKKFRSFHKTSAWSVRWPAVCVILHEMNGLFHGQIPPLDPGVKLVN
ncbi:hypothetical protein RO3G_15491 [Rhizopus delemar RA 99-880]|uniref:Uncharacterized protein n=3 Tax=Rhizopus TaxID=4842 RepID=I1CQQ0_RHIO9|nr:hypothetical protein RO3G_15491 [Rhizopus delemar RA 99-880]|eukprot:EIE90780.1 hypothetical protein RO3G_15491 [Rhizopus delemar RA 99-880]